MIVSAAASLTNALQEVASGYERSNPGIKVILNFASSGVLLQQIEKGAPVDIFAPADQKTMDQAGERGLILAKTRKDFVSNGLVLVVPEESPRAIYGVKGLTQPGIARLAIGNPETVPAGRYAKEALVSEGLWDPLQSKLIFAENVRQALDYVRRAEVDAGFVFATDAVLEAGKVRVASLVRGHTPIRYPVAIVAGTRNEGPARRFIEFLLGDEARTIFTRYGFGRP